MLSKKFNEQIKNLFFKKALAFGVIKLMETVINTTPEFLKISCYYTTTMQA